MTAADRFAGLVLMLAAVSLGAAAVYPYAPDEPDMAGLQALALPVPGDAERPSAYLDASPFDAARRPVDRGARLDEPAPLVTEPVAEAPVIVAGVLVDGAARRVMFAGGGAWQAPGSTVGSWTVAAIEPRRVTLRRGGETMTVDARDGLYRR